MDFLLSVFSLVQSVSRTRCTALDFLVCFVEKTDPPCFFNYSSLQIFFVSAFLNQDPPDLVPARVEPDFYRFSQLNFLSLNTL